MKNRHLLLLATVATGGVLVAFAGGAVPLPLSHSDADTVNARSLFITIDDREEDEGYRRHQKDERDLRHHARDHDDEDDEDDEDEDEDEDEDDDHDGGRKPAPALDATPPDNGLILKGTKPKVQVD